MDGFCAADVGTYTRRRKNFLLSKKNLPDRGDETREIIINRPQSRLDSRLPPHHIQNPPSPVVV